MGKPGLTWNMVVRWSMFVCVHRRLQDLPSPVVVPTESGQAKREPSAAVADTDISVMRPASKVGSQTSQCSLLRKVAINEARREFFSSQTSLVDGASRSKTSIRDTEDMMQRSCSHKFTKSVTFRL